MHRFLKIFSFLLFFYELTGFIFPEFLSRSEGFESQFSCKFRENSSKIGTLAKVFPFFDFRFVYNLDPTLIFIPCDLRNIP